jgi:hypothetical protein
MSIAIVHPQSKVRVVSELAGPMNVFIPPAACVFVDVVVPTACLIGLVRLEFEQSSVHIKVRGYPCHSPVGQLLEYGHLSWLHAAHALCVTREYVTNVLISLCWPKPVSGMHTFTL